MIGAMEYSMRGIEFGAVVHPESWRDEFLDYDYIGLP